MSTHNPNFPTDGAGVNKMAEEEKLLPCPFCGGEAKTVRYGSATRSGIIECEGCGCNLEAPEVRWSHGRAWNTRASGYTEGLKAGGWVKASVPQKKNLPKPDGV